jgi:hypothetical protein
VSAFSKTRCFLSRCLIAVVLGLGLLHPLVSDARVRGAAAPTEQSSSLVW